MRKLLILVFLALTAAFTLVPMGCTDSKPKVVDSLPTDSIVSDTSTTDSTESIVAQMPMPKAADELFDDFVFNFAANKRLQMRRIVFPLPVYRDGKLTEHLSKKQWRMEHFFMHQDYYTLILDNEKQRQLSKDTTITHTVVEKIFFNKRMVQQFVFNRINGQWRMTSIGYVPLRKSLNASFLQFYHRFSTDSTFQAHSLASEVHFTAPDPEDAYGSITGVIVPEQWNDFRPSLIPQGIIYNILYGQKYTETNRKIFLIRGIANGMEMEMRFRRTQGKWRLTRFTS